VVAWIARLLKPFCPNYAEAHMCYNTLGRIPYLAASVFYCLSGAFDPLGIKLLLVSTIPASFGGHSGLLWADSLLSRSASTEPILAVRRERAWWIAAVLLGLAFIVLIGRGIRFAR
jgi:hypothetical protein